MSQIKNYARGWAKRPTKFNLDEQECIFKEKTDEPIFIRKLIKHYRDSLAGVQSSTNSGNTTTVRTSNHFVPEDNFSESMELLEQLVKVLPFTLPTLGEWVIFKRYNIKIYTYLSVILI